MTRGYPITIAEMNSYSVAVGACLSDDEQSELIDWIAYNPTAGDLIPDCGGVRCLVWPKSGKNYGTPNLVCVYYYFRDLNIPVYMLWAEYGAKRGKISFRERGIITELVDSLVRAYEPELAKRIAANRR